MSDSSITTIDFSDAPSLEGKDLGHSSWIEITQERVNTFADATDDHQWIHVDPERAKESPFGGPIAHGFLTLSLVIPLWTELLEITGVSTKVNYGLDRVRFTSPVPVGSRVRLGARVTEVSEAKGGGLHIVADGVIEIEGQERPAVVATFITRVYP
ncbi:MaoC family dehydratase [Corynebacterium uropygiale]|uniref:MaoC family dehydratase n=1 Tax=Corynebacterium uropygiale TaxID=1775911 RepID=A0A9X1QQ02_9CORY|nr:MaoC family dehydratase [Corynebacterium uropygiale]MCF4007482.1 MaoC family dehydratase [Corynebacterium uropygiale]